VAKTEMGEVKEIKKGKEQTKPEAKVSSVKKEGVI